MNYLYYLIEEEFINEDGVKGLIYGVEIKIDTGESVALDKIMFDKAKAETLVSLCNEYDLSPMHFADVLEDLF